MPTRTTGPGTPSNTHSAGRNFGRRRTENNLDTFRTDVADLDYVSRPTTGVDGDNAKDVREKILNGNLAQSGSSSAAADLMAYYGMDATQVANMFKYNAPDVAESRGTQPAYGPNLAIPPFASSRPANVDGTPEDESDRVTQDNSSTIVGVSYGSMANESSDNRADPSKNSSHPRGKRPTMTPDGKENNEATLSTSGVGPPPAAGA